MADNSAFPTSPLPEYPIEETSANPEVLVSRHRDGSEQRRYKGSGDGAVYALNFGGSCPVTGTERATILSHYAAGGGMLEAFEWTHPERGGAAIKVRYLEAPVFTLVGYNHYRGTVKLKAVPA